MAGTKTSALFTQCL